MESYTYITAISVIVAILVARVSYVQLTNRKFRELLKDLEDQISLTEYRQYEEKIFGPEAFEKAYKNLKSHYSRKDINSKQEFRRFYREYYPKIQNGFGEFFRALFNVTIFVYERKLIGHRSYYDAIRSKLPSYAKLLVFYNGLSISSPKFLKGLKKMKVFKNLDYDNLLSIRHVEWYNLDFFGEIWNNQAFEILNKDNKT